MKKKLIFIVNPFSGTSSKNQISQLLELHLDREKYTWEVAYTNYNGHASDIVKNYLQNNDIFGFVAVGGDGTVNEVASQIIGTDIALGILPQGSGNGFGCSLGMSRNIVKSIKLLNNIRLITIDTGLCNNQSFVNVSGIGFDAQVVFNTKDDPSRGFLKYLRTTLRLMGTYKPIIATVKVNESVYNDQYMAIVVANGTTYGYGFKISPDSKYDDALLDLILIRKVSLWKYLIHLPIYFTKGVKDLDFVTHIRTSGLEVFIKSNESYYHVDGEGRKGDNNYFFEVKPASLRLMVSN